MQRLRHKIELSQWLFFGKEFLANPNCIDTAEGRAPGQCADAPARDAPGQKPLANAFHLPIHSGHCKVRIAMKTE
jgi:hypothetical protein